MTAYTASAATPGHKWRRQAGALQISATASVRAGVWPSRLGARQTGRNRTEAAV